MLDGGIFIRDFGTSLQEINLESTGKFTFLSCSKKKKKRKKRNCASQKHEQANQ